MRQLFELCGADRDVCYSPFAWRVHLCLLHKGLDFERVPLKFLEKEPLTPANSKTVPVLRDGDTWLKDSFDIALYLDQTYPDNPLFGSDIAIAQARFINGWLDRTVVMGLFPLVTADIAALQDAENGAYYRETREKRLGAPLEEVQARRDDMLPAFQVALAPARLALAHGPYLAGARPGWMDYALFGNFMWARIVSPFELLDTGDALYAWRERMLDLFGGVGRAAKRGFRHAA